MAGSGRDVRRLAAGYLALQAALGVTWWVALFTSRTVRSWFELMPDRHGGLDAFLPADAVVFVGGSAVTAFAIARHWTSAPLLAAFTAGGTAYATLQLAGWVAFERTGAIGLVPMTVATMATIATAVGVRRAQGGADVVG